MNEPERRRIPLPGGKTGPVPFGGHQGIEERRKRRDPHTRLDAVQRSAQGWATGQVAILGLLGISGVSRDANEVISLPQWTLWSMAALALATFALAATAAILIAVAAWPLYREQLAFGVGDDEAVRDDVLRAQKRMRLALPLTVCALITMGATFALSWWPLEDAGPSNLVRLQTRDQTVCGPLGESSSPGVVILFDGQAVTFRAREIIRVEPVEACD